MTSSYATAATGVGGSPGWRCGRRDHPCVRGAPTPLFAPDGPAKNRTTATRAQTLTWNNAEQLANVSNNTTGTAASYLNDSVGTTTGVRYYTTPGGAAAARTGTNYGCRRATPCLISTDAPCSARVRRASLSKGIRPPRTPPQAQSTACRVVPYSAEQGTST
ncbi:hypothetical protein [Streptomyces sp. NPDC004528]|uniref:hypothetical protein n=1 Tax=Streptomyces sp. NPDC004528 TaxID=3154550 RepID=UPI0033AE874E